MMANRVRPGTETTRLMSRTSIVRKAEWDSIRGIHHGQQRSRCNNRPDTRLYLTSERTKLQKVLATQEPSTQGFSVVSLEQCFFEPSVELVLISVD